MAYVDEIQPLWICVRSQLVIQERFGYNALMLTYNLSCRLGTSLRSPVWILPATIYASKGEGWRVLFVLPAHLISLSPSTLPFIFSFHSVPLATFQSTDFQHTLSAPSSPMPTLSLSATCPVPEHGSTCSSTRTGYQFRHRHFFSLSRVLY